MKITCPIKWIGSKSSVADEIVARLPRKFGKYVEPMIGGGGMLPSTLNLGCPVMVGDAQPELIDLWLTIRDYPSDLTREYRRHHEKFVEQGEPYFYEVREYFNSYREPADFLFLIRNCINGLVRFNSKGDFNSPTHRNYMGAQPDLVERSLLIWSQMVRGVDFQLRDYLDWDRYLERGDIVYLDPPYLSTVRGMYASGFDHLQLYWWLDRLTKRGVYWMLSLDGDSKITCRYVRKEGLDMGHSLFQNVVSQKVEKVVDALYRNY